MGKQPKRPKPTTPDGLRCQLLLPAAATAAVAGVAVWWHASAPAAAPDLHLRASWDTLNASSRATLFVAAAATGKLGSGLQVCASVMEATEFPYQLASGETVLSRGAAAATDLEESFACLIPEAALLSATTVRSLLESQAPLGGQARQLLDHRVTAGTAAAERGLLALLLIRERARERSVLAPYIHACLRLPLEIPAGWDPHSDEGGAQRAALGASRPDLLARADVVRRSIARHYAQLVPTAIDAMAAGLSEGLPCSLDRPAPASCARKELEAIYSPQRFAEVWVAITSRDFVNSRQRASAEPLGTDGALFPATFLVPLVDLMNHGGAESTMRVAYDLKHRGFVMRAARRIARGEQLTFRYSTQLCREEAFTIYGFSDPAASPCPPLAPSAPGREIWAAGNDAATASKVT